MNGRRRSWYLATGLAVASAMLAVASFAFAVLNRDLAVTEVAEAAPRLFSVHSGVSALIWSTAGWYLATRRPDVFFGWSMLAAGAGHAVAGTGWGYAVASTIGSRDYPSAWAGLWVANWANSLELVATAAIFVLYPTGRLPRGITGTVGVLGLASVAAGVGASFVQELDFGADDSSGFGQLENPLGTSLVGDYPALYLFLPALTVLRFLPIVRWLRGSGEERDALRWLAVVLIASFPLDVLLVLFDNTNYSQLFLQVGTALILATVITATLRHRIYGIEAVAGRAYLYAVLSLLFAAAYGAIIGLVSVVADVGQADGFVAALVAALALVPAVSRVQRGVNRFLFGDRDDPYSAISRMGAQLEAAGSGQKLLPGFTESISTLLRVPYAAVDLAEGDRMRRVEYGVPSLRVSEFPLVHDGVPIGALIVGHRLGERGFAPKETSLLEHLARQASSAAANLILTEDLQRSRERLVTAREEERRRLRRDLHDGLGPVLTGAAMVIDAARNTMKRNPAAADAQLTAARDQVGSAITDVRHLIYALRPPALDDLGLVGALRALHDRGPVSVILDTDDPLPELPAAVEVAVFRIAAEAVNNALRHGHATECAIRLHVDGAVELEVLDNGASCEEWRPGVGIVSMRERASELGGTCDAGPDEIGHGRVRACIPIGAAG